ncbi:MAG: tandem-95 repeat protein [Gammaproteobacteria bacterium]|nr:tandem-95 repeat protein [Gammaproteobacteria bacterium]
MKRALGRFLSWLLVGACWLLPFQLLAAERQVDLSSCAPSVSIAVTPPADTAAWAYEESISGLTPANVNGNGVWVESESIIRWGADLDPQITTLSYDLSGSDGSYRLTGRESLDGRSVTTAEDQVILSCEALNAPETVARPGFSQPNGTRVPVSVSISTGTAGASIYYTVDGSPPDTNSDLYAGPLDLTQATTLRAFAVKDGMLDSEITAAYYAGPERILADQLNQSLSGDLCEPVVSIAITPVSGIESYGVKIPVPAGVLPQAVSDDGIWDAVASELRWGAFKDSQARNLSFTVTGDDATYQIMATASFDGYSEIVGGATQVVQDCIPPMAEAPVLDPASGRVPVTVSMTSATEAAEIRFTLDGTEPTASSTLYSEPILIDIPGTIKARAFKNGLEPSDISQGEYLTSTRPKAIIVAGGGPYEGNALWPATLKVSQFAYNALLYQGYARDDIWFISPDTEIDMNGNGKFDDVDALASAAALEQAITGWAADASDLMIYLTDHGGDQQFVISNTDDTAELVSVTQLNSWLDQAQQTIPGLVTLIYDACQSGTFIDGLASAYGPRRVVLTSASNEPALFLEGGVLSFSYQFWASVFYTGKFYDSYVNARNLMLADQRPLLDANSNGIANEKQDRALVQDLVIGRGAVAASVPPQLNDVSPEQSLNGETSATIAVGSITALDPIARVWAVLVPPNYRSQAVDQPVLQLPSVELSDPEGDGSYAAVYAGFTSHGKYRIQLYARDNQGIISLPVQTSVIQTQGEIVPNEAPVATGASYSIAEDEPIAAVLTGSDDDGDQLTFVIVSDGEQGTVTLLDVTTGAFRYRPHAHVFGDDQFQFLVNDGIADSEVATVSITVSSQEDVPEARDVTVDGEAGMTLVGHLDGFDGDGDTLEYAIATAPAVGQLTLDDAATGAFTFVPGNAAGLITFTYVVTDGKATSAAGTVSLNIDRGYNTPPLAGQCDISVSEDGSANVMLSATDAEGDAVVFRLIGAAAAGEVTIAGNGAVTYTPNADYAGPDNFAFGLNDGFEEGEASSCSVTVTPVNDAPTAMPGSLGVTAAAGGQGLLRGEDIDGDALSFEVVQAPRLGQVEILDAATGDYRYTPDSTENGTDSFTFRVHDGALYSEPANVQVGLRLPQAELIRSVVDGQCEALISIEVTPVATVKAYAVVESMPPGVVPDSISGNGIWESDTKSIRWGTFKDNQPRSFSYGFTADDGEQKVVGIGSFDGWDQAVDGPDGVSIDCAGSRVAAPVITPASGARVPLDMTISTATDGASIYYTLDGIEPTQDATLYEAPVTLNEAAKVRARAFKDGLYKSRESVAKYRSAHPSKAIVVVGGPVDNGNLLWSATAKVAQHAYRALLYQGFQKDEIQVLSPTMELDMDGNGEFDDVDDIASNDSIEHAITQWAADAGDLLVYLTGHGGTHRFQVQLGGEILEADNLDLWLDQFQQATGGRAVVIYDACRSGSFLSSLIAPAGLDRVVMTSSSGQQPAWFINQGSVSFSYQFWSAVFGKANLIEAFLQGQAMMRHYQVALIDTNGDGIADTRDELPAAGNYSIGRNAVTAAFEPQITQVSEPQSIGAATTGTISISHISAVNTITRVWAVILPPGYDEVDPDLPVVDAIEIEMTESAEPGVFSAVYEQFVDQGIYKIAIYAQDAQGLLSAPVYTQVLKGQGSFGTDTDGDGFDDSVDVCPAQFDDQLDFDEDGEGDVCDADDDNDGVDDAQDAFPLDASEQLDTDNDGIGNEADDDDDGDGLADAVDPHPLNPDPDAVASDQDDDGVIDDIDNCISVSNADQQDLDQDGTGNSCDNDDDNDGVADTDDAFPLDAAESVDTDNDGTGNNADNDDDGDGVDDADDAFPLDAAESSDSDNDGIGDNEDAFPDDASEAADDDADGIGDNGDNCPILANADQLDSDADGQGNVCDDDDDNDGVSDEQEAIDGTDPLSEFSCLDGCFSFDIDRDNEAKALSDGLLVIRHLFGFSGQSLTQGAVSPDAVRPEAVDIKAYLEAADTELDIDGDGESKALSDGLLFIRYLFGFTGDALISNAVAEGAQRQTADEIIAYISKRIAGS